MISMGIVLTGIAASVSSYIVTSVMSKMKGEGESIIEDVINDQVIAERTAEQKALVDEFSKVKLSVRQINIREKNDFKEHMDLYVEHNKLNERKARIKDDAKALIADYKKKISYDEKINAYKQRGEEELASFKEAIDYDKSVKDLKAKKKLAEETYSKQIAALKLTIGSGEEGYSSTKKVFKNDRDEAIRKADEAIEDLNDSVKRRKEVIDADISKKIAELKDDLYAFEGKVKSDSKRMIGEIDKQIEGQSEAIRNIIEENRSFEDGAIMERNETIQPEMDALVASEKTKVTSRIAKVPTVKYYAAYLVNKKWSVNSVLFIASLPIVAVGYGIYRYCNSVKELITAMKELKGVVNENH